MKCTFPNKEVRIKRGTVQVTSAMPFLDVAVEFTGRAQGGIEVAEAIRAILIRLARAARALDHMLAALSNPLNKRRDDVMETAAEAFDRELLYLAAAFDVFGRLGQRAS